MKPALGANLAEWSEASVSSTAAALPSHYEFSTWMRARLRACTCSVLSKAADYSVTTLDGTAAS